jgi:predicted MFS family arabinose efflux permease
MILFLLYMRRRNIQKNGVEETPVQTAVSVNTGPETGKTLFDPGDKKSDFYRYRSWIGVFCSAIFMGILINILPLHIRDGMGFSERTAGLVLFFRCATGLVGFTILARITSWHYNRRWFIILQCGLILSSFLFLVAGNRLLIYFMIAMLYGIIHCSCSNNSLFYSGSSGKNSKKNLAIHEMINSFGSASGTAAGGFLYQRFRFTGVCLVLLLFYGAGLWIIFTLNKRETRLAAGS